MVEGGFVQAVGDEAALAFGGDEAYSGEGSEVAGHLGRVEAPQRGDLAGRPRFAGDGSADLEAVGGC